MKHTIETLSQVTLAQVSARLAVADARIRKATGRANAANSRVGDWIAPSDVVLPSVPEVPAAPNAVTAICGNVTRAQYSGSGATGTYSRSCLFDGGTPKILNPSTPAQLVEAIKAADSMADEYERICDEYLAACHEAVRAHASEQAAAVNELVGLVAQVSAE